MNRHANHESSFLSRFTRTLGAVAALSLVALSAQAAESIQSVTTYGQGTPNTFKVGKCNEVKAVIHNDAQAKTLSLMLHLNFPNGGQGQYSQNVPFRANETKTVTFSNVSAPNTGNYGVTVFIGTAIKKAASPPPNATTKCAGANAQPDLYPTQIGVQTKRIGYCSKVNVVVRNNGDADVTGNIRVALKVKKADGTVVQSPIGLIAGLNAKSNKGCIFEGIHFPEAGNYTLEATADDQNQVQESNEGNNTKTQAVTIPNQQCLH